MRPLPALCVCLVSSIAWTPVVHATPTSPSTRTLVVLLPGFGGFQPGAVADFAYFVELQTALERAGFDAVTIAPPPVASSEERGLAVRDALVRLEQKEPHARILAIAHSQGGVDVRAALAAGAPIHAVATLSAPHHGTDVADVALGWPPGLVTAALHGFARAAQWSSGAEVTTPAALASLRSLSRRGMRAFNARHPKPAVPFFSVAAFSGRVIDEACSGGAWDAPRMTDTLHPMLVPGRAMIRSARAVSDDGVVPTHSMRYGRFLGCVAADHVDWQRWDVELEDAPFDAVRFLVELARGLEDAASAALSGTIGDGERAMDAHVPALASLARARLTRC